MIDHTAYPDIVDEIFSHAELGALLTLRAACSSFRDRVDARLAVHLVCRDDRISPSPSKGWHPAFLSLRAGSTASLERVFSLFAHTTRLDVDAEPDFPAYPRLLLAKGAFKALHTVRLRPTARIEEEEASLELTSHTVIMRTPWPPHPSSGFPITEPAQHLLSATRVVYNVDPSQPLFPSLLSRSLTPGRWGLRELVIVFLPPLSPVIDARDRALLRTIITKALEAADPEESEEPSAPLHLTFVNVGEVPRDCIPIPSSEFDDYVTVDEDGVMGHGFGQTLPPLSFLYWRRDEERDIHPLERYVRATLVPELGRDEVYRRISFLSMNEYRAQVGEEAFKDEVEWSER